MISSTRVDSAPLSWNASLSSDARTCSFDWNGNAIAAAITHAAMTTHFVIDGAVLQRALGETPGSGRLQWIERAMLDAPSHTPVP